MKISKKQGVFLVFFTCIFLAFLAFKLTNISDLFAARIGVDFSRIPKKTMPIPTIRIGVCVMRWRENLMLRGQNEIENMIQEANNYYKEVSGNNVSLKLATFVDPGVINGMAFPATLAEERNSAILNCDQSMDFNKINALIIYPSIIDSNGAAERFVVNTTEGYKNLSIISVGRISQDDYFDFLTINVLKHEMGHASFNQVHAGSIECNEHVITNNFLLANAENECQRYDYSNPYDIMGNMQSGGHISGWGKVLANDKWISYQEITQNGDYLLTALETKKPSVLRIPLRNLAICIEYRKPMGLDEQLSNRFGNGFPSEGVLLIEGCSATGTYKDINLLLDTSPHPSPTLFDVDDDLADSGIHEGTNFSNELLGIRLNWHRTGENQAAVHIDLKEKLLNNKIDLQYDILRQEGYLSFWAKNSSERSIQTPFTVLLSGQKIGEDALSTINRLLIPKLRPGGTFELPVKNPFLYSSFLWQIDTTNKIQETNEENNSLDFLYN